MAGNQQTEIANETMVHLRTQIQFRGQPKVMKFQRGEGMGKEEHGRHWQLSQTNNYEQQHFAADLPICVRPQSY